MRVICRGKVIEWNKVTYYKVNRKRENNANIWGEFPDGLKSWVTIYLLYDILYLLFFNIDYLL